MTEPKDESKGERTRRKLVATTAELLQRQGYHATGLSQIVAESGAPRGSLYFYFPDGKDQLAVAALDASSKDWRARIDAVVAAAPDLGQAVEDVCKLLADDLAHSDYQRGCPVAAVALEAAATSGPVRKAVEGHYAEWSESIVGRLGAAMPRDAARQLATFVLSSVEGALLLAKVQRSREPLLVVGKMLRAMAALAPPRDKPVKAKPAKSAASSRG